MIILSLHKEKKVFMVSLMQDGLILDRKVGFDIRDAISSVVEKAGLTLDEVDYILYSSKILRNPTGIISFLHARLIGKCERKLRFLSYFKSEQVKLIQLLDELILKTGRVGRWNRRLQYYRTTSTPPSSDDGCWFFWRDILKRQERIPHPSIAYPYPLKKHNSKVLEVTADYKKKVLLFVHISTHFKEIWRVALLLKHSNYYFPIVFFDTAYEGHEADIALCRKNEVNVLTSDEFNLCVLPEIIVREVKDRSSLSFLSKIQLKVSRNNSWRFISRPFIAAKHRWQQLTRPMVNMVRSMSAWIASKLTMVPLDLERLFSGGLRFLRNSFGVFLKLIARYFESPWIFLMKFHPVLWGRLSHLMPSSTRRAKFIYQTWPSFLEKNQISLLILPEHNLFYFTQIIADLAKKKKIPSVIVPFTIANTIEWSEAFYSLPSSDLRLGINRAFAKKFPHWVINYKNKPLILPAEHILLNEMLGTTPSVPWLINSGAIDAIAVESPAMHEYYIKAGIPKEVLQITGALYDDELYAQLSQADSKRALIYRDLGFSDVSKPMLLVGFPPNQLSNRKEKCEFKTFEEIAQYIFKKLSQVTDRYNIVVNPHPRIDLKSLDSINQFPLIKLSKLNIAELVPLSSIYVASCSATIRMAVASGIPVLNYDLYRYDYDDYKAINGVINVDSSRDFEHYLNLLTGDSVYYHQVRTRQKQVSQHWGCLDGKSGERMLKLFDQILNRDLSPISEKRVAI